MRRFTVLMFILGCAVCAAPTAGAKVLLVGTYHGIKGQYRTIQAAVDAAKPGDWILIGPGDYKTTSSEAPSGSPDTPAGVLITKPDIWLRGMNRNTVIVDGTRSGAACNSDKADQNLGPSSSKGPLGLNGVEVYKADDVWVQNLTACNFLSGSGDAGNEIWWNGGDGSYTIGGHGFYGSYLNATSTFFDPNDASTAAAYGIFSNNWSGGTWDDSYTSNFDDSGYYIGACQQVCDQTVDHAWAEFNALGYSGSNSGGQLVIENSQFDNNLDGFDTNSQNGDEPSPQNGACPNNGISPITHTHSCWVFMHNYSHDNNDPNVPSTGFAAAGPVGTGISLSGARNDTVMDNTFARNGAWGTILVPFPDPSGSPCIGGTLVAGVCFFYEWGDAILDNTYSGNGFFGNPSNGDIAETRFDTNPPSDCFRGNVEQNGAPATTSPPALQTQEPTCSGPPAPDSNNAVFDEEVLCDTQFQLTSGGATPCLPTDHYPRRTTVVMHPLPPAADLPTMPNPCAGVPANAWCTAYAATHKKHHKHKRRRRSGKRTTRARTLPSFTG